MAELESDPAAEFVIHTRLDPTGDPIITLSGELDIAGAGSLEKTVAAITAEGPVRLIFDLSQLRFMDSAGIAVLVSATKNVDAVTLRNPTVIVRRVLELTGLSEILPIEA
jgi:anti-sigma B factor antagonist